MHNVYVIISEKDNRMYVGMTQDINKRLQQHNSGYTRSTKGYRPWRLFYTEQFATKVAARNREVYLKSGYGKQWLKNKWKNS